MCEVFDAQPKDLIAGHFPSWRNRDFDSRRDVFQAKMLGSVAMLISPTDDLASMRDYSFRLGSVHQLMAKQLLQELCLLARVIHETLHVVCALLRSEAV